VSSLVPQPPDALLGLIALFKADPRPDKIDLGVGIFRDATGATPVMRAVKSAEALLLSNQSSKSYLGAEGDEIYTGLLGALVLGSELAASDRITGIQTPGGTGALRLGAELIGRAWPDATVWIGTPTWPNHGPIFSAAGLAIRSHRFYDVASATIDFDGMMSDLAGAKADDILLLHGCCHNPTGAWFAPSQWAQIAELCVRKGLIPFVDLAYQGLDNGLEEDAVLSRAVLERVPNAFLAYSCDKNFGLYRDRVGALWVQWESLAEVPLVRGNLLALARSLWSMPPDHGAAVVRTILQSPELTADWTTELTAMRERINGLRRMLASAHPRLSPIAAQRGIFAMLPITSADVADLREAHGVYMTDNGRINIAGLTTETIPAFVAGLAPRLAESKQIG
jgi:aromatic-amino-acid transaminase